MLLSNGVDLFTGRAYQFYLAYKDEVNSWDNYVALLKDELLTVRFSDLEKDWEYIWQSWLAISNA